MELYRRNQLNLCKSAYVELASDSNVPDSCPLRKCACCKASFVELQAGTSHDVCDNMHGLEDQDMFEVGKVCIAREALSESCPACIQGRHGS